MITELRFALRRLVKSPGFTLVAVLTLALGIGANTAIFSVVNGVLFRPLPFPQPGRLVTLTFNQSGPELEDIAKQNRSFTGVGGLGLQAADFSNGGEPEQWEVGLVAGDYFAVLGTPTALGRTLAADDDRFGGRPVLMLSYEIWQKQFAGDPAVLGRTVTLAGQNYTIVGVTASGFRSTRGALDAYTPYRVFYPLAARSRGAHLLAVCARLQPGLTVAQAQNELRLIDRRMAAANPDENRNRQSVLVSLHERLVGDARPALLVLFGAVGLVLLVGCANFANLLLARMASRKQEMSVRSALGAGRGRLIAQVLTESVLLALLGGMAGLVLGSWGIDALLALRPADLPQVENVCLDGSVLAFTFGLSLLTGIVFGLLPAWQATRVELPSALGAGSRSVTIGRSSFRGALVVAELALALALLIGAGLLGKAFLRLTNVAPGFETKRILTMRVELPEARYRRVEPQTRFREQLLENLNTLPGVEAAMISELPLGGNAISHNFIIEGRPAITVGEEPELYSRSIAGDYFKVMGIPLIQGRAFNHSDQPATPTVGVINLSMAQKYFRGTNPIGARIRWARDEGVSWITIVGVVGNVRHFSLAAPEEPAIYTPFAQSGQQWKRWSDLVIRDTGGTVTEATIKQLKAMIWKVDPLIPVTKIRPMSKVMAMSLGEQRFNTIVLAVFAGMALLLAGVGLYGVLAFLVTERTREIGIRMALGATTDDVLRLVLGQGLALALTGVLAGLAISLAGTRVLAGLLYGVSPTDPVTFLLLGTLLVVVGLAACYFPARRATRVNPIVALHYE